MNYARMKNEVIRLTISFKISENTKEEMIAYFADKKREKTPAYAIFQADEEDTVVTLYQSLKVVFQGTSADIDAAIWKQREKILNPTISIATKDSRNKENFASNIDLYYESTIGSDEVGTGDYFGPIIVTSTYVDKKNIPFLEKLGVKDSKKLTDEKILKIVPIMIKQIPYESIILSNDEYNQKYSKDNNMNKMKAILHNNVLLKMKEKYSASYTVVDQFAKPYVYYHYLQNSKNICKNITFVTKGEDKCLSVACASLISRYIFIQQFKKIEKKIGENLPKGASHHVDQIGAKIVQKYGIDILSTIAKLNFKNTEKIKELLNH